MTTKNKKRGQRIIKSARQRKRKFFQTLTPKQRREYEEAKEKRKNGSYTNYQFSRKENFVAALVAIGTFAVICGVAYLLYLGIKLVISLVG